MNVLKPNAVEEMDKEKHSQRNVYAYVVHHILRAIDAYLSSFLVVLGISLTLLYIEDSTFLPSIPQQNIYFVAFNLTTIFCTLVNIWHMIRGYCSSLKIALLHSLVFFLMHLSMIIWGALNVLPLSLQFIGVLAYIIIGCCVGEKVTSHYIEKRKS